MAVFLSWMTTQWRERVTVPVIMRDIRMMRMMTK